MKKIFTRILIIFSINWKYSSNLFSSFYSQFFFLKKDFKGAEVLYHYELHLEVPDRCPIKPGDSVQILGEELQQFGYKPLFEEWSLDTANLYDSFKKISKGFNEMKSLEVTKKFNQLVSIANRNAAYEINIGIIHDRFKNNVYRRESAAFFDVQQMLSNVTVYAPEHKPYLKNQLVITDLINCLIT